VPAPQAAVALLDAKTILPAAYRQPFGRRRSDKW
jgi:hypothetical protein